MATTHIYNKLQDTSIYINLSSQNLHSAIAALKQEAKPLTTLNIKGFGDTKKRRGVKRPGKRQETRRKEELEVGGRDGKMAGQSDAILSKISFFCGFLKKRP